MTPSKLPDFIYGPHKGFSYWLVTSLYVPFICAKEEGHTYLFSSSVLFVQANANMSLLASFATEAILNCDHPNSHSALSPAAMALQYTTERRLGWILKRLQLTHCWVSILKYILLKRLTVRLADFSPVPPNQSNPTRHTCRLVSWHFPLELMAKMACTSTY